MKPKGVMKIHYWKWTDRRHHLSRQNGAFFYIAAVTCDQSGIKRPKEEQWWDRWSPWKARGKEGRRDREVVEWTMMSVEVWLCGLTYYAFYYRMSHADESHSLLLSHISFHSSLCQQYYVRLIPLVIPFLFIFIWCHITPLLHFIASQSHHSTSLWLMAYLYISLGCFMLFIAFTYIQG